MYTHRLWGTPGGFSPDDVDFMTEPFADAERLVASWGPYALAYGAPMSELPMLFAPVDIPTLVLYGPDDHVVPSLFVDHCEVAFTDLVGPFLVPRAGHFLQWERADLFNRTVTAFCRDLLAAGRR
jgi:pimeloyl-ACP methyl ester carboxylesterase